MKIEMLTFPPNKREIWRREEIFEKVVEIGLLTDLRFKGLESTPERE